MVNETTLQWYAFGNMIALSFASLTYGFGGMSGGRILRRFISPLIIYAAIVVTAVLLHQWSALTLIALPLLIVRNSLGYGGNNGIPSWLQRFLIAALSVLTALPLIFAFSGGWWLLPVHAVVAGVTVFFAWRNPVVARMEETMVCVFLNAPLLMYNFVV
jgi:hypothetical protein